MFSASLFILSILNLASGEKLQIPFVQSAVAQQLAEFSHYTAYAGPTGTAAIALSATEAAVPKPKVDIIEHSDAVVVANTYPYWYETIAHQGKAAFNTNSSYAIYRNVKTYGAKG